MQNLQKESNSVSDLHGAVAHSTDGPVWVTVCGRAGYAAKGVVYLIIGALTVMQLTGWGSGGEVTGSRGALVSLNSQPYGDVLLFTITIGLLAYTAWRWAQGFLDVEHKGTDRNAWVKRIGLIISGALYAILAVSAAVLAMDKSGGNSSGETQQQASEAMRLPGGEWLVVAAGVGFVMTGGYQFYRSFTRKYTDHWKHTLSGKLRRWATKISRFGIAARALVFLIMGGYIAIAGVQGQAEKAKGLGETLRELADLPWLLATIAVGLFCYGLYSGVNAMYREIPAKSSTTV